MICLNDERLLKKSLPALKQLMHWFRLVEGKESNTPRDWEEKLRHKLAPFNDVPIVFMSVLEKQRIMRAIDAAIDVHQNRSRKITTSVINEWLQEAIGSHPPPSVKGRFGTIKYMTQLPIAYPIFALFCNNPSYIRDDYKLYLENRLRQRFNFKGVPITLSFREK